VGLDRCVFFGGESCSRVPYMLFLEAALLINTTSIHHDTHICGLEAIMETPEKKNMVAIAE
jgi:hypothetical protein